MSKNNSEVRQTMMISDLQKQKKLGKSFYQADEKRDERIAGFWSFLVFFSNVRALFFALFWASADESPSGFLLFWELFFEYILFLEILIRMIFKNRISFKLYHAKHENNRLYMGLMLIGSLPFYNISLFAFNLKYDDSDNNLFHYTALLKIIRCFPEIYNYMDSIQEIIFYKNVIYVVYLKIGEGLLFIAFYAHVAACLWQFIQKNHPSSILSF